MKSITTSGKCAEYQDLWKREAKRGDFKWRDLPEHYHYIATISPNKRITSVMLFHNLEFIGAGVAIRNPVDKYHEVAGIRLAMARALHSIHWHRNGNGRRGKK